MNHEKLCHDDEPKPHPDPDPDPVAGQRQDELKIRHLQKI